MDIKSIISISRPRFWLYIAGTYLVGYSFGIGSMYQLQSISFFLQFLYFLIPANIFLYGINDISDEDTDQHNKKKGTYEHKLISTEKKDLKIVVGICFLIGLAIVLLQKQFELQLLFTIFIALSFFYSSPPLRFKSKPILDSASNILYGLPGIIGYFQVTNALPKIEILIAIFSWTFAMHLFSAIPDIEADKKAKLKTTAVLLGRKASLILCAFLWTNTSIITIISAHSLVSLISLIYPLFVLILLFRQSINLEKAYKIFPYLNGLIGFILFMYAVL